MIEIMGHKVYETLPAWGVDLDKVSVSTLGGMVADCIEDPREEEIVSGLFEREVVAEGTTSDGIHWAMFDGIVPDLIIDVPEGKVTEDHLVSLIQAGVIPPA